MSLFGLWARRCNRWLLGLLAVMAAVEIGLFLWAMARYPLGDLDAARFCNHLLLDFHLRHLHYIIIYCKCNT